MQHDEIIKCPKSGGDLCYKIEVNKDITNYFSLSCGFWTNTLMVPDSEFYNEQWEVLPELYKDLAWTDVETGLIWVPNTVNHPEMGMVFAEGPNKDDWNWAAVKATPVLEEEKEKYPDPLNPGEFYKFKMDIKNIKRFDKMCFMDAAEEIGLVDEE